MIIDYALIRNCVENIVRSRKGMPIAAVSDIAGFICEQIHIGVATVDQATNYLEAVLHNDFGDLQLDGQYHTLSEHVSLDIINNPLYLPMERKLVDYTAGAGQIGPGEFILCWYDSDSSFQTDNNKLGDVTKRGVVVECKKINGNNYTTPALFNLYVKKGVDVLMGWYTVSKVSVKPTYATQYCATPASDWQSAFAHKLNNNRTGTESDAWSLTCTATKISVKQSIANNKKRFA